MAWKIWRDEADRICAEFTGKLTTAAGRESAREFVSQLPEESASVVFDIAEMGGYESGARAAWQQVLWPYRKNIRLLTLIGGNAITRMGGQILGLALGLEVDSVKNWDELR